MFFRHKYKITSDNEFINLRIKGFISMRSEVVLKMVQDKSYGERIGHFKNSHMLRNIMQDVLCAE